MGAPDACFPLASKCCWGMPLEGFSNWVWSLIRGLGFRSAFHYLNCSSDEGFAESFRFLSRTR